MPKNTPKRKSGIDSRKTMALSRCPLDIARNRCMKRLIDVVGGVCLIVITLPLQLAVAIGVRVSSAGPILFRQARVGKGGRTFTMYKFRSMRVNAEEETGWSVENDPRRTRFGALIRRLSLDELPQLYNVLRGEMSLVGPRPEMPFYVVRFQRELPSYSERHRIAPGITGLAQIKGLRGDTSIAARLGEDLYYIENWSLGMDLKILLMTPFRALNRQERLNLRNRKRGTREE